MILAKLWRISTGLLKSNPNYSDAYNNRGLVYARQDNLTQAMSDFNQAIEINPSDAKAYFNRGHSYYEQGSFAQGIPDFDKVIEINPNDAPGVLLSRS